ncbi:MAG TPA: hypothetical protein VFQ67_10510 [Allosphingosinicella sp.]|jgi:hypothetical protein|nr:hypothetical protein [Allosphingosinicella sp.]
MRIIFLAAAAIGMAAIGTAAEARPGAAGSGHGSGPAGAWSGGHRGGQVRHSCFGCSAADGDRRPGRGHGRHGRDSRHGFLLYGGAGIAVGTADPYGNGFFTGGGGRIRLRGGRPYFDYDRAYPYEWASAAGGRREWAAEEERPTEPRERCTLENGVRVCRGW